MAEAAPADEVTPVPPAADDAAAEEEEEEEQQQLDEVDVDDGDVDAHEPLQKKYYRENSPTRKPPRSEVWKVVKRLTGGHPKLAEGYQGTRTSACVRSTTPQDSVTRS